ncbi:MAG: hypothetical protein M0R51_11430 [Clostridia bacterium]|jgi:hypothetical protein|nr:hypothetical protein [Clostridia bacterium]
MKQIILKNGVIYKITECYACPLCNQDYETCGFGMVLPHHSLLENSFPEACPLEDYMDLKLRNPFGDESAEEVIDKYLKELDEEEVCDAISEILLTPVEAYVKMNLLKKELY